MILRLSLNCKAASTASWYPNSVAKRTSSNTKGLPLGVESRLVILHGKESFLRSGYTDQIRTMIEALGVPIDVIRFDGESAAIGDVLDECRSLGLMGQHKLVVVDRADELAKSSDDSHPGGTLRPRDMLERYAQAPEAGTTLILRSETWRPGKLDKLVEKVGTIIKCDELTPQRAMAAVGKRAKETFGVSIEPAAVDALVEQVGVDLSRLSSELGKLAAGAGKGGTITLASVRQMVGMSREDKAWTIQDVLLDANPQLALLKLHELIEISRVDLVPIRWACVDLARKLHAVSREIESGVPAQVAGKSQRLWGPSGQAVRSVAKRAGARRLASLLHDAVATDVRAKTGQGDAVRGLERLILRFASTARS